MLVFGEREKPEYPGEKPLRSEWITNKFNPNMTPSLEIEPGPPWWKTSAPTTAATLLSPRDWFELNINIPWWKVIVPVNLHTRGTVVAGEWRFNILCRGGSGLRSKVIVCSRLLVWIFWSLRWLVGWSVVLLIVWLSGDAIGCEAFEEWSALEWVRWKRKENELTLLFLGFEQVCKQVHRLNMSHFVNLSHGLEPPRKVSFFLHTKVCYISYCSKNAFW